MSFLQPINIFWLISSRKIKSRRAVSARFPRGLHRCFLYSCTVLKNSLRDQEYTCITACLAFELLQLAMRIK